MTGPAPRPPHEPTFAGTPPFPVAARAALADAQLRANLGRATATIRAKRAAVVAERADWEALRLAGAAIKDEVLRDLPSLLEELEQAVTAAGGIVHWARDAAEANAIVADVALSHGAREVVKVKSMATQEIELNEALRQVGIDVWETDLAEMIVQLGHDLPSHILVPAIHRNRTEIRDIFLDEMGRVGRPAPDGLTDEPGDLAEAARLHLREKFLRARVAVSGANFAVAQTGTVVVVESEGNGRMCLTLPDVLITVMGIEKLVPTWRDLEVFLQSLPRSATAERMNPYTSMWTGVTPGDGPQAFHLILLDNGRTDVLSDTVGRQALRCIRCSACLNVCPVYERTGGRAYGSVYPGPIGAILTPQLRGINVHAVDAQTASLPYASSLCGACFEVCPVRIDIPEVLVHLRGQVVRQSEATHRLPTAEAVVMRAAAWTLATPRRLGLAERAAGLGGRILGRKGDAAAIAGTWSGGRLVREARPQGACPRVVPCLVAPHRRRGGRLMAGSPEAGRPSDARESVLARIRESLADRPSAVAIPRDYELALPPGADVTALFVERVSDYRATVHRTMVAGLPAMIAAVLRARGATRLAVPARVPDAWLSAADVERVGDDPPLSYAALDALEGVITGCAVAVAETGTIVLDAGPDQGRRVLSLLPDLHVCVVTASQVVGTVPEALARLQPTRPQTWISGPSATSDIELQRVEGVHGPRTLDVILVDDPQLLMRRRSGS